MQQRIASTSEQVDTASRALVALTLIEHAGSATLYRCLQAADDDPERLLSFPNEIAVDGLETRERAYLSGIQLHGRAAQEQADAQIQHAVRHHASIVTYKHQGYPKNLRGLAAAPPVLYVRGALSSLDEHSVAVVGSRAASLEGRKRASKLARMLVERHWVVVSGLARGIDTAAHTGALAANGRTVAVVGCGLDQTYPRENTKLAEQIAMTGALISQFPFGSPPNGHHFPMRNKTMALLSLATVVVEASEQSGAKMQADFALKSDPPKRQVFLMRSLVEAQDPQTGWAQEFIRRGATALASVDELVDAIQKNLRVPLGRAIQLSLLA